MTKGVEEDSMRGNNDFVSLQHTLPQLVVLPLIWFICTRDHANRDRKVAINDFPLLFAKGNGGDEKPRHLRKHHGVSTNPNTKMVT